MNWYIKEKCHSCSGVRKQYPQIHCTRCDSKGCIKIGIVSYVFLFVARQLNLLLKRYGE